VIFLKTNLFLKNSSNRLGLAPICRYNALQKGEIVLKEQRMRRLMVMWIFAVALSIGSLAWADGGKTVTQKYEVVCLKCMAHNAAMGKDGGHGAGHAACAMSCSMKGMDLGLMDENGGLYVPVNSGFQSARDVIKDKAGQTVELTGTVINTKGIQYLQLADSDKDSDMKKKDDGDGDKD
jgi:hypothetical protein